MSEPHKVTKIEIPGGFTCEDCDKYNKFDAYVFAHWRVQLNTTCECGTQYHIIMGQARKVT